MWITTHLHAFSLLFTFPSRILLESQNGWGWKGYILGLVTFFTDQAAQGPIQPGTEPFQQWGILFQGLTTLTVKSCIPCTPSKSICLWSKPTAPRTVTTRPRKSLSQFVLHNTWLWHCIVKDARNSEEICLSSSDILILLPFSLVQLKSLTLLTQYRPPGKAAVLWVPVTLQLLMSPKGKVSNVFWVSVVMFIAWPKHRGGSALG